MITFYTYHSLRATALYSNRNNNKKLHSSFYYCDLPGAILAFMLGAFRIPLTECEDLYRKLGSDVFKQNAIVGTVKMGWSHAFYDTHMWENLLK